MRRDIMSRRKGRTKFETYKPRNDQPPIYIYFNKSSDSFEANVQGVEVDDETLRGLKTKIDDALIELEGLTWVPWIIIRPCYGGDWEWSVWYLAEDGDKRASAEADWDDDYDRDSQIAARKMPTRGDRCWLRSDAQHIEFTWERLEALRVMDKQVETLKAQIENLSVNPIAVDVIDAVGAGEIDPVCEFLRLSAEASSKTKKLFKKLEVK
jgi:hypothetical protein